jgi:hypothetical protein
MARVQATLESGTKADIPFEAQRPDRQDVPEFVN